GKGRLLGSQPAELLPRREQAVAELTALRLERVPPRFRCGQLLLELPDQTLAGAIARRDGIGLLARLTLLGGDKLRRAGRPLRPLAGALFLHPRRHEIFLRTGLPGHQVRSFLLPTPENPARLLQSRLGGGSRLHRLRKPAPGRLDGAGLRQKTLPCRG